MHRRQEAELALLHSCPLTSSPATPTSRVRSITTVRGRAYSPECYSRFPFLLLTHAHTVLTSKEIDKFKKRLYISVQEKTLLHAVKLNFNSNFVEVSLLGLCFQSTRSATQDEIFYLSRHFKNDIREKRMPQGHTFIYFISYK